MRSLSRRSFLFATQFVFIPVLIAGCDKGGVEEQVLKRFPIEVESCICRHLAFEADGITGVPYADMVNACNKTIREGHRSLPPDLVSSPSIDSLRCTDDVDDWQEEMVIYREQQESNRLNFEEFHREDSDNGDGS